MVWRKRGKYGVHSSGRTLRAHIPKFCSVKQSFEESEHTGFSVRNSHTWLDVSVRDGKGLTQEEVIAKSDFPDIFTHNGLPIGNLPTLQETHSYQGLKSVAGLSLNKKKRWLLPELLKRYISEKSEEKEFSEEIPTVTLVERNIFDPVGKKADCLAVYTTRSSSGTSTKQFKSKYAQMKDLREEAGVDEETPEICYQVSYSYPRNSRPNHPEIKPGKEVRRFKKDKNHKRSVFRTENLEREETDYSQDESDYYYEACEVDDQMEESPYKETREVPITFFISSPVRKNGKKNKSKGKKLGSSVDNLSQKKYGKGEAIVIENPNAAEKPTKSVPVTSTTTVIPGNPFPFLYLQIEPLTGEEEFIEHSQSFPEKFSIDLFPKMRDLKIRSLDFTAKLLFEFPLLASEHSLSVKMSIILSTSSSPLIAVAKSLRCHLLQYRKHGSKSLHLSDILNESARFLLTRISCDQLNIRRESKEYCQDALLPLSMLHKMCGVEPEVCEVDEVLEKLRGNDCSSDCKKSAVQKSPLPDENDVIECGVCFAEKNGLDAAFTSLKECCHWFCNQCWIKHIMTQLQQSQMNITCPAFNCKSSVNDTFILSMVPTLYQRFSQWKSQSFITKSEKYVWCPGKNCQRVATVHPVASSGGKVPLACVCGVVWCVDCQEKAHWPATCEDARLLRDKVELIESGIKSVLVKNCPKCKYPIEKYLGCPHMVCTCGHAFCWECLGNYSSHGWEDCLKNRKELKEMSVVFFDSEHTTKFVNLVETNHIAWSKLIMLDSRSKLENLQIVLSVHKVLHRRISKHTFPSTRSVSHWHKSLIESNAVENCYRGLEFKYQALFVLENVALAIAVCPEHSKLCKKLVSSYEFLQYVVEQVNNLLSIKRKLGDPKATQHLDRLMNLGKIIIKEVVKLLK